MQIELLTKKEAAALMERLALIEQKIDILLADNAPRLLSSSEAAEHLGISRTTLDRYTALGAVKAKEIDTGKYTRKYYSVLELNKIKNG